MDLQQYEPDWKSNARRLFDLPAMSKTMYSVMAYMNQRDDVGYLWLAIDGYKRTVNALVRRDWIVKSEGLDGIKYQITQRGREALKTYSLPVTEYRFDDICPTCEERPVHYSASGRRDGYCLECVRAVKRRFRKRPNGGRKPGQLCPDCGKRERHVAPSGKIRSYCLTCRRRRQKEYRKAKYQRKLEQIAAGEFIQCCKCEQHVHYGDTYVSDYCAECLKEYMDGYNKRRRGD